MRTGARLILHLRLFFFSAHRGLLWPTRYVRSEPLGILAVLIDRNNSPRNRVYLGNWAVAPCCTDVRLVGKSELQITIN